MLQQRTKCQLSIVAVGKQNDAGLSALKAYDVILRAVTMAFLEDCWAVRSLRQPTPYASPTVALSAPGSSFAFNGN